MAAIRGATYRWSDLRRWLADGDVAKFFDPGAQYGEEFFYPPLVHFVGGIPSALRLATQDWAVIAELRLRPDARRRLLSWSAG